jgi:hypothetical protein
MEEHICYFLLPTLQLSQLREDLPIHRGLSSLRRILTLEFVQAMKEEPEFASCSGMDWFTALSVIPGIPPEGEWAYWILREHPITAVNILSALEKLLSVIPMEVLVPALPQIKTFTHQFDTTDVSRAYALNRVFSCINKRFHSHEKFSCTLCFD